MRATLRLDGSRLERYLQRAKTDGRVAASRALTRTMQTVASRAGKVIAADVGLPQRRVRDAMRLNDPSPDKLTAELVITGKKMPLADFNARQTSRGVTYRIGRLGRRRIPSGFLVKLASGHRGVFVRFGRKHIPPHGRYAGETYRRGPRRGQPVLRQPIVERFGPSLPHIARQTRVDDITRDAARPGGTLAKNLDHELRFLARQGGAA